jgi:hypothetical protein
MHGGGSPDGAKLVARFKTPFEEFVGYAQKIMGIDEKISEPAPVEKNDSVTRAISAALPRLQPQLSFVAGLTTARLPPP